MSGLTPLSVVRVPVKQGKEHGIAAPVLERLRPAEPAVSPPPEQPRQPYCSSQLFAYDRLRS